MTPGRRPPPPLDGNQGDDRSDDRGEDQGDHRGDDHRGEPGPRA